MTARAFLMVMTAALLAGCSDELGTAVPLQRIRADAQPLSYYSGYSEAQRLVVRDAETWRDVWMQIWRLQSPPPELPVIDFDREMVLVAALGERPTGGYSIILDSAHATADRLTVSVRVISPGSNCGVTLATTQPVDVARVPRVDSAVQFMDRTQTHSCS